MHVNPEFETVQQIGDASSDGVVIYSLIEDKILYANSHARDLVGLKGNLSRVNIESILEFVAPQDKEYLINQYLTIAKKQIPSEVEFRIIDVNKRLLFVCCNAYLVADESAVVVFIKDITKPKEHQNYLVEYGARKNTVLDNLAHHISGALTLMQHLSLEAGKYVENTHDKNLKVYLDLLNDNSRHCIEIIHDLLKNEHGESPSISIKNSRVDVIEIASYIYKQLVQSYQNRKFHFMLCKDSLYINTDEVKLLQVINNLTSNAVKFSAPDKVITIEVSENESEVIVSVKDGGIGIPDDLKPFIFQVQFGAGRKGLGEKSIGLGLSISFNLIQLMKGKIWFESTVGEGSTFYFSLPKV
jgi:two-component system sensor histidine kinase VicK